MASRLDLHAELESLQGLQKAYFQPPESVKLKYDCIIYSLDDVDAMHADDFRYQNFRKYQLILISKDADCGLVDSILNKFKMISFDRYYSADNLHHWAFSLYY